MFVSNKSHLLLVAVVAVLLAIVVEDHWHSFGLTSTVVVGYLVISLIWEA